LKTVILSCNNFIIIITDQIKCRCEELIDYASVDQNKKCKRKTVTFYFKVSIIQSNYLVKYLVLVVVLTWNKMCLHVTKVMEPVLTVCNYVDVIHSYCYTYLTDRVCYTDTYVVKRL